MSTAGQPDPPADLAAEAARLVGAARDWALRVGEQLPPASGAPECTWCPVCRTVALLRGERLDVNAALAEFVAGAAALFAHDHPPPGPTPTPTPHAPATVPIELVRERKDG